MIERMRALLKEKDLCVLATSHGDRPHCSLMAYVTDEAGERVFMLTDRKSRKYSNIMENPRVSLLVDTRCEHGQGGFGKITALTVYGTIETMPDRIQTSAVLRRLVSRHPGLHGLAAHPDAVVLSIRVDFFLLLDGVSEAHYETA